MRRLLILPLAVAALLVPAGIAHASGDPSAIAGVTVTGDAGTAPQVQVTSPFSVKTTKRAVTAAGTGTKVASGQKVSFDYVIVDGRDGKQLESSYGTQPLSITLDKTSSPVFVHNLVGTKVGSRVVLAVAPKDGLASKLSSAGVKKNDTLVFVFDLKGVSTPLSRATGDAVAPAAGLPTVKLGAKGQPKITVPKTAAPTQLVVQPLIKGHGPAVTAGQTITVQYTGVIWGSGKQFDSSWARGAPAQFPIGNGSVIKGWDDGLVGQTVGSQVLLVIPPAEGYGSTGSSQAGITGTDTLVFVVDILDAT